MIHVTEPPDLEERAASKINVGKAERVLFKAEVKAAKQDAASWKETADVVSVSHSGTGFYIRSECTPGQLVSLMLPMPLNFRRYDYNKKLYKIWGLVQHCNSINTNAESAFHVGVAFIGRSAPASYFENPRTSYRVCGIGEEGLWEISPIQTTFQTRREPRFLKSIDVSIYELDQFDVSIRDERTATENISENGASVISSLNVNVGDRVRVYCPKVDFSAFALVRNRQEGEFERPLLHLEFVDCQFPVSVLDALEL
jgi:PilZ domain